MNSPVIKIGCDPELFVTDKDGSFLSAHTFIPGTKKDPHPVNNGAIQVDGVAAEFNINPSNTYIQFASNIKSVMGNLKGRAARRGYNLLVTPTAKFKEPVWAAVPSAQKILGCDPDYNAYTAEANPRPDPHDKPMRTGAGHVHIGYVPHDVDNVMEDSHFYDCCVVVKNLDYMLGLPSLLWDNDNERRSLYGKAGAFRPKPYGCEYRTLSNMWLSSDSLIQYVFAASVKTLRNMYEGTLPCFEEKYGMFASDMINSGNSEWYKTKIGADVLTSIASTCNLIRGLIPQEEKRPTMKLKHPLHWDYENIDGAIFRTLRS